MGGHDYSSHGIKSLTKKQKERILLPQKYEYVEKITYEETVGGHKFIVRTRYKKKKKK